MKKLTKIIEAASNFGAALSSLFFLLITLFILVEVFLRAVFNTSTLVCDEFSAYMFVWLVMLGLSYTFKENAHIRINILLFRLNRKFRWILENISLFLAFIVLLFIFYHSLLMVLESYHLDMRADTIAETPLFIPQIALPVGFLTFALQVLAKLLQNISKGIPR
ncbi:Tripartite ATP-independent periplasmic transporter DctQ component [Thermodesulfatator indicus DSM 15286]|uniref:Tripartite ATP-independent periplasmic transporter DctQ component n=1 Tax=Thermodesulfatator indicus (strain DSM 15286 / JCM 11887 / CIR29812) TaxID=667014 RepID=F8ABC0_THEID|nr:TRAP transporter small permease [Thermodesulfatator indicus]AEH44430.1 Tripartite ATP-independent periplasmic transporter DctQ component [Thermodesulfatator indicus DSM 15286]